jgi:guanylate kinase
MRGNLYVITGPSGVGKTTVAMELLERRSNLKKVVTCTTRSIREGEVAGESYYFLSEEAFKNHIEQDEMFEWARVYETYYGSRKQDVEDLLASGNDVLFVIDVQGAKTIREDHPEATILFLKAESDQELMDRIVKRDQGATTNLEERKAALQDEMAFGKTCKHQIVNKHGELEQTVQTIMNLMNSLDENT